MLNDPQQKALFWCRWYLEMSKHTSAWLTSIAYSIWEADGGDDELTDIATSLNTPELIESNIPTTQNQSYWQPGDELKSGKYIIEKELGRGGFGITYLATNYQGELVVIKIFKDDAAGNDLRKLEEDFVNEAVKLSQFKHPNIVPIIEVVYDGRWCIVMKYIKGKTLESFVKEQGISPKEALHITRQIGEALKAVHAQGLLHRDVKPHNILIQEETNTAVLIDFGLALKFDRHSAKNNGGLTDGYAPLEQYQFSVIWDYYTDVYALAATLYFMLTKTKPVSAKKRASGERLASAKELNPAVSQPINEAIEQGMALDPAGRPATIEQWLELLKPPPKKLIIPPMAVGVAGVITGLIFYFNSVHRQDSPLSSSGTIVFGKTVDFGQEIEGECTKESWHILTQKCNQENYFLTGKKGDRFTINMNSDEIDPVLVLTNREGNNEFARNDDIAPDNMNAEINIELPVDGNYRIIAQSSQEQELGKFTLKVTQE